MKDDTGAERPTKHDDRVDTIRWAIYAFGIAKPDGRDPKRTPQQDAVDAAFRDIVTEVFTLPPPHEWPRPDGVFGLANPLYAHSVFGKELLLVATGKNPTNPRERALATIGLAIVFVLRRLHSMEESSETLRESSQEPLPSWIPPIPGFDRPPLTRAEAEAKYPHVRRFLESAASSRSTPGAVRGALVDAIDGSGMLDVPGFLRRCRAARDAVARTYRTKGKGVPLRIPDAESRALMEYMNDPSLTQVELAERVGCNKSTLARSRATRLATAMRAHRGEALDRIPRGSKSKDGTIEARDD